MKSPFPYKSVLISIALYGAHDFGYTISASLKASFISWVTVNLPPDFSAFSLANFNTSSMTSYPSGCAKTTSIPNLVRSPITPWGTLKGFP